MRRRPAIKKLLVFCGTAWFIPASLAKGTQQFRFFDVLRSSNEEIDLLSEVVELIIPETDTPGAKKLGVHLFVLTMIQDCTEKKQQNSFMNGLKELNTYALKFSGLPFLKANLKQRQQILSGNVAYSSADFKFFLAETKRLTIQGYTTSEYVMTSLIPYELIPGRFEGCIKVKT